MDPNTPPPYNVDCTEEENHRQDEGSEYDTRRELVEKYGGDGMDAQPPEASTECNHFYVNVGFHWPKWVCKHCNLDKPKELEE